MPEYGIPVTLRTPIGDLVFNNFAASSHFRLTGFDLSKPRRSNVMDYPQRDGAVVPAKYKKGAYATLSGEIASFNDLVQRAAMLDQLRAFGDAIQDIEGTLLWTPTGQAPRQMAVTLLDDPTDSPGAVELLKTFQLQLIAADPTTYGQTLYTIDSTGLVVNPGGTFTMTPNFTFPISFGNPGSGGLATLANIGNAPTWPIVRIYGQLAGPQILNQNTGLYVSLPGLQLNAGQYAEIDMRRETVRLNGDPAQPLTQYLDNTVSTFWPLQPGASVVQLIGSGFDANAKARIIYRDGYA